MRLVFGGSMDAVSGVPSSGHSPRAPNRDDDSRRLEIYRRRGLFGDVDPSVSIKRATTAAEWIAALELVHDHYVICGYILPQRTGIRARAFDLCRDTGIYIAVQSGRVVGVLTTILDTGDLGLPSDSHFPDELEHLRGGGAVIGELSNLVIVKDLRNSSVFTELTRCNAVHALYAASCTDLVCAVSQPQQSFYELLGFSLLGSRRSYSDQVEDYVVLMRLDQIQTRWSPGAPRSRNVDEFFARFFLGDNEHARRIDGWKDETCAMFDSHDEIADLVFACRESIAELSSKERAALRRRLGRAFIDIADSTTKSRPTTGAFGALPRSHIVYLDELRRKAS